MLKIIKKTKKPKFLVITPLRPGDMISRKTLTTVKANNTQFDWVVYEGVDNIPTNTQNALNIYETCCTTVHASIYSTKVNYLVTNKQKIF